MPVIARAPLNRGDLAFTAGQGSLPMLLGSRTIVPLALAAGLVWVVASHLVPSSSAAPTDPDATATQPAPTQSVATQPTSEPTPAWVREAPSAATLVTRYLDSRFGRFGQGEARPDWYANIRSVRVRFGTVIVQTDLSDHPGDQPNVMTICQAVLGFRDTAWGQQMDGLAGEVYDPSGRLLAQDRAQPSTLGRAASRDP
jgi:hypothetical protein